LERGRIEDMESSIKCEIESREGKASANPNMLQLEPSEGDGEGK
jgi:hypothetical protein